LKGGLKTINLILIRHGETNWNLTQKCQGFSDIELNQNGRRQIKELAQSLKSEEISAVYSSDLRRAKDTAVQIAKFHNLSINVDPDLREMNQGKFEGLSFIEIRELYSELLTEWRKDPESVRIPGGETLIEVQERAWKSVQRIIKTHHNENVVAVSHNFTIITLLCKFKGIGLREFFNFKIKAASKNIVSINKGSFKIDRQNDTTHLSSQSLTF
jgi:broad specificity phosphatase PhoE